MSSQRPGVSAGAGATDVGALRDLLDAERESAHRLAEATAAAEAEVAAARRDAAAIEASAAQALTEELAARDAAHTAALDAEVMARRARGTREVSRLRALDAAATDTVVRRLLAELPGGAP